MEGGEPGREPSGRRDVPEVALRSVVTLIAAAVLWRLGHITPARIVASLAVVLFVLGLASPALSRRIDHGVQRLAIGAANGVGTVLSLLAWVLVVLPVWALSRAVRYSPLDDGWSTPRTAWIGISGERERSPIGRPSSTERMGGRDLVASRRAQRRSRFRLLIVLLVLAVPFAPAAFARARDALRSDPGAADLRTRSPDTTVADESVTWMGLPVDDYAHEDEPWAKSFFRELYASGGYHDLILGQRLRDFDGDLLNIVDGRRVSYLPDNPTLTVWFFGGSTMFGIGQRDEHTIPSVIARLAEAEGIRIRSENFGVSGYVNWVSTMQMVEALQREGPPDLIVFYDGANDEGLAYQRIEQGDTDPRVASRLTLSDEEREAHSFTYGPRPELSQDDYDALFAELAGVQYSVGVRAARQQAAAAGVPVTHFWQPIALSKRPSAADAELYDRLKFDQDKLAASASRYRAALARADVGAVDLSTVFDRLEVPVYFDWGHTNELGARTVAEAMYGYLGPQLRELANEPGPG